MLSVRKKILRENLILGYLRVRYIYLIKYWDFRQKLVVLLIAGILLSTLPISENELLADGAPLYYIVKKDDCLFRISRQYRVSLNDLVIWNNVSNTFTIYVGQKLIVSKNDESARQLTADHAIYHSIKKGENIYRLSLKYNTTIQDIVKWNSIKDISNIDTGTRLIVGIGNSSGQPAQSQAAPVPSSIHLSAVHYKIKKGDNLYRVSLQYNVSVDQLMSWNQLPDPQKIDTGFNIIVGYMPLAGTVIASQNNNVQKPAAPTSSDKTQPALTAKDTQSVKTDTAKIATANDSEQSKKAQLDSAAIAKSKEDSTSLQKQIAAAGKHNKWLRPAYYLHRVATLPLVIAALIITTAIFVFFVICLLVYIIILRIRSTVNEAIKDNFDTAFEELITLVIFSDHAVDSKLDDDEFDDENLKIIYAFNKKYMNNPYQRQLCIDSLLNIYKNLSGIAASRVVNLYHEFRLSSDSVDKLKNTSWHLKAKGIQEVEQMHVKEAYKTIYNLIDHPNDTLRYEAQVAVMSLREEKNLAFLEDVKLPLTEWQQMMLTNKLHLVRSRDLSNVEDLLNSENHTVKMLAIKVIQDFNMMAFVPKLEEILHEEMPEMKIAAARALGGLIAREALPALLAELKTAPHRVKEEILHAISKIGIESNVKDVSIYIFHDNFEVAHAAANALISAGETGLIELRNIINNNDDNIGIHVFNSLN